MASRKLCRWMCRSVRWAVVSRRLERWSACRSWAQLFFWLFSCDGAVSPTSSQPGAAELRLLPHEAFWQEHGADTLFWHLNSLWTLQSFAVCTEQRWGEEVEEVITLSTPPGTKREDVCQEAGVYGASSAGLRSGAEMLSLASLLKSYWFPRWDEARGGNPVQVCMCIDFLITIKTMSFYWHFSHSLMVFGATVCLLPVYVCIFELWLTFNATNLQRVPLALCSVMSWTGLWMFICVISNKKARSRLLVNMSDWRVLNDLPLASTSPLPLFPSCFFTFSTFILIFIWGVHWGGFSFWHFVRAC